jgi:CRP/FNR family transcriptional regulator
MIPIIVGGSGVENGSGSRGIAETGHELERAELFRVLAPERLARLRPLLRECCIERQRVLYFEGAPAERLWVVRAGEMRLYKSSPTGQIATLDVLGPGEIFGALSALADEVYPASAEAVSDCVLWWMPRETFLRLLHEDPRVSLEVLAIVSRRLREAHERLRSFAYDPAPARLARALMRAATHGEAHVTRRALAEAAGTTVETAIRVLRRFERAGLVRGKVGHVTILDEAGLRRAAGELRD